MSAVDLMAHLGKLGVRLEVDGDRLRYSPRSAVTPELAGELRTHKTELVAILQADLPGEWVELERRDGRRVACRLDAPDPVDWGCCPEPETCPTCGAFDAWWDVRGGRHCAVCNPPHPRAAELRERARARTPEMTPERVRPSAEGPCWKCGHAAHVDIEIHGGQSVRRDCKACGATWDFVKWYGEAR